jgi:uncharacterized membrane protein
VLGQHELQPGRTTTLKIVYNTYKFPGKFEKYVTLFTGPEGKKEHKITLTGNVDPIPMGVVDVDPRKLDAGDLTVGQAKIIPLVIKNTGDADMKITKVYSKKHKSVYFSTENNAPMIVRPGESEKIPLELVPEKPGRYLDYVMIDSDARNVTEKGYKVVVVGTVK